MIPHRREFAPGANEARIREFYDPGAKKIGRNARILGDDFAVLLRQSITFVAFYLEH